MPSSAKPVISTRKQPKQGRSKELVAAILQAAIQVLEQGGIQKFTTARVAEKAGVSVGSLYQYFPNKAAILFQLQVNEWQETNEILTAILEDKNLSSEQRIRSLIYAFIKSECDEASVRTALNDATPYYRHSEEAKQSKVKSGRAMEKFIEEILPQQSISQWAFHSDMIFRIISSFGKQFSDQEHSEADIRRYSDALSDMVCAYLTQHGAKLS